MKLLSAIYVTCILFIASESFRTLSSLQTWNKANSLSGSRNEFHLNLFNLGKKTDSPASNEVKAKILSKYKQEPGKLEKISRSQNRDYEAEAKARAPKPQEIKDKQVQSFNFGKTNEFPNLFKGWIKKDGDQIAKQIIASTKVALKKEKYIEIIFDPVPNLDEVAFGTVPDYATNRGGPATLEWSNIYWANRLSEGLGIKNLVALSISGEGTKGQFLPTLSKDLQLVRLTDAKKMSFDKIGGFVILSPCQESHYSDAKKLGDQYGVPVIALNSPYSYRYDVGGGGAFALTYVMKRIPKGWIYRQYPKPFECIIEGPNYEVFRASTFNSQPKLTEISKVSMAASEAKYGAIGNDRIFEQRL